MLLCYEPLRGGAVETERDREEGEVWKGRGREGEG
jgi:hypothetical protein